MLTGAGPIKQAFVRALRDITALKAAVGSDGIDEAVSLTGVSYPRVVYSLVSQRRSYQFGSEGVLVSTIDSMVVSDDQVQANSLDQLMLDGLENASLDFSDMGYASGQEPSTLLCRRLLDLSFVELDDSGNKVYRVGGTYQIWLDRL